MPSSSQVRPGGRRRRRDSTRLWAELPLDAISAVFHKLDHIDILTRAGQVCRSWRSAALNEPELYRHIDMPYHSDLYQAKILGMARAAVLRSNGQCEAFWVEHAGDDDFLLFLGSQAPSLKSLRLVSCYDVSTKGFAEAIQKFPLLEELELFLCTDVFGKEVIEIVGKSCRQLKRFRLSNHRFYNFQDIGFDKDGEARSIATMTELRSLQIFGNNLTNKGLAAILDNCSHLESLDIRHCFNVKMDDVLQAKCARLKTLKLPHDLTEGYEFQVSLFGKPKVSA